MFNITKKSEYAVERPAQPHIEHLEDIMTSMLKYGKPRVSYLTGSVKSGWYSNIEMNVNSSGVTFNIQSDFDHPDPISAAKQCRERLLKAVSVYKE